MRVTIHQPEHLPWLGLLAKVRAADLWLVLDHVAYRKNYFQNRNRVLVAGAPGWVTVPVSASAGMPIDEVRIADVAGWSRRYLGRLEQSVQGAAGHTRLQALVDAVAGAAPGSRLVDLNVHLAGLLMSAFGVTTPVQRTSTLHVEGNKSLLIRKLCQTAGADVYLAGPSGRDYLDLADFEQAGIEVEFFDFTHPVYPQEGGAFVSHLSAVDAWARLGPGELAALLDDYRTSPT